MIDPAAARKIRAELGRAIKSRDDPAVVMSAYSAIRALVPQALPTMLRTVGRLIPDERPIDLRVFLKRMPGH